MSLVKKCQSNNAKDRIDALNAWKDDPVNSLECVETIFKLAADPLSGLTSLNSLADLNEGKEPSQVKARRIFRKHIKVAIAAILAKHPTLLDLVATKITDLPDGEKSHIASAISTIDLHDWILNCLASQTSQKRDLAASCLFALAMEFYGRVALQAPSGPLANIISSKPVQPEVLIMINEKSLAKLLKIVSNESEQFIKAKLAKSLGSFEPCNELFKVLKILRKDNSEFVAEAAQFSFEFLEKQKLQ